MPSIPTFSFFEISETIRISFNRLLAGEQATLKFSTNLVLAGGVAVMVPVNLSDVIASW